MVLAMSVMATMAFAAQQTVDCGSTVTIKATPKAGYHFVEWNDHNTNATRQIENITANQSFTATFAPNTDTKYTVKHWLQNITDDLYPTNAEYTDNLEGTTDEATEAEAKDLTGFTAQSFLQSTIAGDESTVINIYYTRNSYTLAWATDGNALSGNYTSGSIKYGAEIIAPATPTKTGYVFAGWTPAVSNTMPAANTTYTATWEASAHTAYIVKHYQQNIENDEYTEVLSEDKEGTTGANTAAAAQEYEGFTAKSFSQATIAADGSTVIAIYYDRNRYTITFKDGPKSIAKYENLKFGATFNLPANPASYEDEDAVYNFSGWTPAVSTIVSGNATYTAQFTATPKYTITGVATPDGAGTVIGGGKYVSGSKITLTAQCDDSCYEFEKWSDGETSASREVTVSENATFTAIFKKKTYTITIESANETQGTVSFE